MPFFADSLSIRITIRVYNLHLESHKIIPSVSRISRTEGRLFKRVSTSFANRASRPNYFDKLGMPRLLRQIVCGDFNNTNSSMSIKL